MKYETKFAVNDAVFFAGEHSVERDIIKAIKITSRTISYGVKDRNNMLSFMFRSDGYSWYPEKYTFEHEAEADKAHLKLKAEYDKKEEERKQRDKEEKIAELKAELIKAEAGIEDYE